MAVDPRFQGLQSWLLDSPMPRPPIETWPSYPEFQQTAAVRYRWCEVWVDPVGDGNFQSGWVYGKYITPL